MANKLRNVFSNNMVDFNVKLQFESAEAHSAFYEAMQIVNKEGRSVDVQGITEINTEAKLGEMTVPFREKGRISKFTIFPHKEIEKFPLLIKGSEKILLLNRYFIKDEMILENNKNEAIYFRISFIENASSFTFTYTMQPNLAKTINDIVESFDIVTAFMEKVFIFRGNKDNVEYAKISKTIKFLKDYGTFFNKLFSIEEKLGLTFLPEQLNYNDGEQKDIEELYYFLIEKKAIRLNAKLTSTESTGITIESGNNTIDAGCELALTFQSEAEYKICNLVINIYTANFVGNAIVKEIIKNENGSVNVLYGDTDSKPMYISCTGYQRKDEATEELKCIMEQKEKYIGALTLHEYIVADRDI